MTRRVWRRPSEWFRRSEQGLSTFPCVPGPLEPDPPQRRLPHRLGPYLPAAAAPRATPPFEQLFADWHLRPPNHGPPVRKMTERSVPSDKERAAFPASTWPLQT